MKILIAEPNKLMQKVLEERLKTEKFEVVIVDNGLDAFEMIENQAIDLVVSEELLPYKNGFELIRRANEMNIPIIIISDADLEEKILEAFELGASDFIDKPFSPNELVVRVKNALKRVSVNGI
jgi:two-component system, OmpR family, response regulator VicR